MWLRATPCPSLNLVLLSHCAGFLVAWLRVRQTEGCSEPMGALPEAVVASYWLLGLSLRSWLQSPSQPEPRALWEEVGSHPRRAELVSLLFSCCITVRWRSARPGCLPMLHSRQRCSSGRGSCPSPHSPLGAQVLARLALLSWDCIRPSGMQASTFHHSFTPQIFLGPYAYTGSGGRGGGP